MYHEFLLCPCFYVAANKSRFCNNSETDTLISKRLSVENKAKISQLTNLVDISRNVTRYLPLSLDIICFGIWQIANEFFFSKFNNDALIQNCCCLYFVYMFHIQFRQKYFLVLAGPPSRAFPNPTILPQPRSKITPRKGLI